MLCFFISAPALSNETSYSSLIEDLPLMQGMLEQEADSVVFDKPSGRIIESVVISQKRKKEIKQFYKQNLPPLGWRYNKNTATFSRENENLKIVIKEQKNKSVIHFIITPKK